MGIDADVLGSNMQTRDPTWQVGGAILTQEKEFKGTRVGPP